MSSEDEGQEMSFQEGVVDFFGLDETAEAENVNVENSFWFDDGDEKKDDDIDSKKSGDEGWMNEDFWQDIQFEQDTKNAAAPPESGEPVSNGVVFVEEEEEEVPNIPAPITRGRGGGRGGQNIEVKGRGRGRGRAGRSYASGMKKKRKEVLKYPYFMLFVTILDILFVILSLYVNEGFEKFSSNPWFGPSVDTLVAMGAKWVPYILDGEAYRLFTAIFLHTGFIHLLMNLSLQIRIGFSLEKSYGFYRIAPIYILCGLFGNLISSIFLPKNVTVGASGSLFGFMGVLIIDLFQNWSNLKNPKRNLFYMCLSAAAALLLGLLPYIDNFAHLGGFVMGIITGIIFLPNLNPGVKFKVARVVSVMIAVPICFLLFFGLGFAFFYTDNPDSWCSGCEVINCLPVADWCSETD